MTNQDFIKKHSLSVVQIGDWRPAVFLMDDDRDDPRRFDDHYKFYANADRTIWVSINETRNRFRIVYADMFVVYSNWERTDRNYVLAPLVTDPPPGM
jgi:uncharacterized protein YegL